MLVGVTATAYDIKKLGYFKSDALATSYPLVVDIMKELVDWGATRTSIENTSTYAPSSVTTEYETYLVDTHHDLASDEFLLVLWKKVKSNKGDVYALTKNRVPGKGTVTSANFDPNVYIPGFPIYFWVRISDQKVVSLVFDHSERGKLNLQHYLLGFLRSRSKWVVSNYNKNAMSPVRHIQGYSHDGDRKNLDTSVDPKVDLTICKRGNNIDLLHQHLNDIRRLQRLENINMSAAPAAKRTQSERMWNFFFGDLKEQPNSVPTSVKYKSELPWRPDAKELNEVYDNALDAFSNGNLLNLTAVTRAQKRISFLGNALRENIELKLPKVFDGYIPASELYSAIDKVKADFP